jgi:two-component system, cell cycle sensor histidine kinase and response regulator CckA
MEMKEQLHVLVIEDDEDDYFIARRLLSKTTGVSCDLDWARTFDEGLERVTTRPYDVALVDYRLDARTGLELLKEAQQRGCETPIILLTGQGDLRVDLDAMAAGAADYLVKGQIDSQLLERSIRYARERKRAEERIREQAAFLEKARDAISAFDMSGNVIYWNPSAEAMTGYTAEEAMGRNLASELYPGNLNVLSEAWETIRTENEWSGELRQRSKDGGELLVESRWTLVRDNIGNPRSVLVINTDVTERKRLETQFLRTQRMESIGSLVGGIAHDLGNLLVPVLLGVQVLEKRFEGEANTLRTLEMIGRSAQRGADMVRQVLAFARGVEGERVPLRPERVIHEVERITEETFPPDVEVDVRSPEDLWMIKGDTTQVQQVIMNLCVNARDAMPEGGRLRISAENVHVDQEYVRSNIEAKRGPHVCLKISDTGTGIPSSVLDKMFEPFFTTKPTGKGTGLGLSTVYSIVKSHGGFVNVLTSEGEGTTFSVFFPAVLDTAEPQPDHDGRMPETVGDDEMVLVVDDEQFILELTRETLESAGYRVITASDGVQALERYRELRNEIDVVITDLMMPEMDGITAIRELKSIRADLPIIAASGVSGDRVGEALDAGASTFLAKPFTAEVICRVLQEVLHPEENEIDEG